MFSFVRRFFSEFSRILTCILMVLAALVIPLQPFAASRYPVRAQNGMVVMAQQQRVSQPAAAKQGMEDKSKEFRKTGAKLYS